MEPEIPVIPQIKPQITDPAENVLPTESKPEVSETINIPQMGGSFTSNTPKVSNELPPKPKKPISKVLIGVIVAAVFLVLYMVGSGVYVGLQAKTFYTQINKLKLAVNEKDLGKLKTELASTEKELKKLQGSMIFISWARVIPFVGGYVSDANHALKAGVYGIEAGTTTLNVSEPYLDFLGFGGVVAQDNAKSTEERIDFFVKAIPDLIPKLDEISGKIVLVQKELSYIDATKYPVKVSGREVREPLKQILSQFDQVANMVVKGKPLLEELPYLLGIDKARTYLVLFQNDKELRPTGGFLTAYSIMKVDKAKFSPVISDDIYNIDAKYRPVIPAPQPLIDYLKGPYILSKNIRLRDINWSPDFSIAMKTFIEESSKVGIKGIDGVIAVDTQALVNLLEALGPIEVPGFGNYRTSTEPKCNCPQVVYELESFADVEGPIVWSENEPGKIVYRPPNSDNRKKIIGPLMNAILSNTMAQPKEKLPVLFEAGIKSLNEKHVLFYLFDEKVEAGAKAFGIAGDVKEYSGDYFSVIDANLGGRKSNLYVTQEVNQEISVARDGTVEKTVSITYKNPEKYDGWLNSVLPNWVRVYVPKGSTLISMEGYETKVDPAEDLGKTVFAGLVRVRPEGVAKVTLKYKLPEKVKGTYKMLIQKQSGTDKPLYTVTLGRKVEEFFLNSDKEIKFGL